MRGIITLGVALVTIAAFGLARAAAPLRSTTHHVLIEGLRFSPEVVKVNLGDRIEFKNADLVPHTASSTAGTPFDSGILESGRTWSFTCETEGTVVYRCNFHPTMTGSIVVQPGE